MKYKSIEYYADLFLERAGYPIQGVGDTSQQRSQNLYRALVSDFLLRDVLGTVFSDRQLLS